jgi:hypothetical protein
MEYTSKGAIPALACKSGAPSWGCTYPGGALGHRALPIKRFVSPLPRIRLALAPPVDSIFEPALS